MLPICYETGLVTGHAADAPQFMSVASETFVKEVLSSIFSRTRSNGPGTGGSAGSGGGAEWIMSHKYRVQLKNEEEAWLRGELHRDKSGLLPAEAKAASERGALGMADVRTALEMGDCGLGQMPSVIDQITFGYKEGELEAWDDYYWLDGNHNPEEATGDIQMGAVDSHHSNGIVDGDDTDDGLAVADNWGWEGGGAEDREALNSLLDSCLAIGS